MALSHRQIWEAIDSLAARIGTTPSGLARLAGLDPTSFNRSKRGSEVNPQRLRWPSTESLAKILVAAQISFSEFAQMVEGGQKDQSIPLIGMAQAGSQGFFDDAGFPVGQGWDEITLPGVEPGLYALEISGDSMLPLYRDGDRIIVDPHAQNLRRGDRVVVRLHSGEVMAKELVRQSTRSVELNSLNPNYDNPVLKRSEIDWVARIVWASQ